MNEYNHWVPPTIQTPILSLPGSITEIIHLSNTQMIAWESPLSLGLQTSLNELTTATLALSLQAQQHALATQKDHVDDWVTNVDRGIEWIFRSWIAQHFPDDGIVGEEWGISLGNRQRLWVLDPIDGTHNYVEKTTGFSVLIGCISAHGVVAASLGDARTQTVWSPNDPFPPPLSNSPHTIATEYHHYDAQERDLESTILTQFHAKGLQLRSIGLSLLDLLHGKHSVFYKPTAKVWDLVAPLCIIESTGFYDILIRYKHDSTHAFFSPESWACLLHQLPHDSRIGDVVVVPKGELEWAKIILSCIPPS